MGIGIDLGTSETKIVGLSKDNNTIKTQFFSNRSIFNDQGKYDPEKLNQSMWISNNKEILNQNKILPKKKDRVVIGIPSSKSIFKFHKTLDMPNDELISTLELEAKKLLPGSSNVEPIIDYHILGQDSTEIDKINLILMGANREIVSEYNEIGKKTGFKNIILDTEASAILNCYLVNYGYSEDGVDVIINIGANYTSVLIVGRDKPIFFREIDKGFHVFVKEIITREKLAYNNAFEKMKELGVNSYSSNESDSENELIVSEINIFLELIDDVRKTLRYYLKNNPGNFYKNFYLSGGGSQLVGLKELVSEKLKIEIEYFNPFKGIDCDQIPENYMQYTTAVGLALRSLYTKTS